MSTKTFAFLAAAACVTAVASLTAQTGTITIRAASAFDGRGRSVPNAMVVVTNAG